ncbi:MAG: prohibitin family protein [Armatimonadota bacterium]
MSTGRDGTGRRPRAAWLIGACAVVGLGLIVLDPFVEVGAGERAVLFSLNSGTLSRQLGEGTHLIVPWVQRAEFYDVRSRTYTMSAEARDGELHGDDGLSTLTKDGQVVRVDISVRFHPDPEQIYRLHQKVGKDYVNKILRPEIRSQTRIAIAEYPVDDVYSAKREEVQRRIEDRLRSSLSENHLVVEEVLLRNIQFSDAFAQAVEQKQIAQQDSQRMRYVLQKAELERKQKVLEAQGDAKSIELRGQAIAQNARVVQYEYARKLAPNVSAVITDGRSVSVPFSGKSAAP